MQQFERELSKAIKRRLLEEVNARAQSSIVNNVYGGRSGKPEEAGGSLQDRFSSAEDPFDYKVKIGRRQVTDKDGNVIGWDKDVHRYREPKRGKKS